MVDEARRSVPKIFVDSDAFVALVKENDTNRKRAESITAECSMHSVLLITSNYVFSETVTVMSQRIGKNIAEEFISNIHSPSSSVLVRWVDEVVEERAIDIFRRQLSKNVSFVDCVNMAILEEDALDAIFSFDAIYKKNGFQTVEEFLKG